RNRIWPDGMGAISHLDRSHPADLTAGDVERKAFAFSRAFVHEILKDQAAANSFGETGSFIGLCLTGRYSTLFECGKG
ncbi:MAG: hypothetical protein JXB18_11410, partial [Sedimentisphaerales bacterium]|nr:hypothetical protein [Sedimentisphaerales bacterium]